MTTLLVFGGSFFVFFAYTSFFEWVLHKYLMHMTTWNYPFTAHALTHHGLFRAIIPTISNEKRIAGK